MDKVKRDYLREQGRQARHFLKFQSKDIQEFKPSVNENDRERVDMLWVSTKFALEHCSDTFKPTIETLYSWMHSATVLEKLPRYIKLWRDMVLKLRVSNHLALEVGHLDQRQLCNINRSVLTTTNIIAEIALGKYIDTSRAAHLACQDLLKKEGPTRAGPVRANQDSDDELCICCLDDVRSLVYKPCNHRVCCEQCAVALWATSRTCPWCRAPCDPVSS